MWTVQRQSASMSHPQTKFGGISPRQLTLGERFWRGFTARSNYIDQRAVVNKYGQWANPMMLGAGAGYTAWHTYKAQPEERKKTFIQDALVFTAAIGGSILAARRFKPLADEGKLLVEHAKENLGLTLKDGKLTEGAEEFMENFGKTELPDKLKTFFKDLDDEKRLTVEELKDLYGQVKAVPGIGKKRVAEVFENLFDDGEGFWDEAGEAAKFFGIGGIGVLSGIAGGLVANKINGVKDPDAVPNMIKEGIFQFVANIAMCAVGAGAALALLNSDNLLEKGSSAQKAAKQFTDLINNSPAKKLLRTAIIMAGLSVGIFGGSHMANYVGENYVNPMLDRIQGKAPAVGGDSGKRHLELCDWMLHLDDIPTALAIAGMAILGPWIIPFFVVSGYRAGIGYRNDEASKNKKSAPMPAQPNRFSPATGGSPAFAAYYQPKASGLFPQTYDGHGYYRQQANQAFSSAHPSQQRATQFRY